MIEYDELARGPTEGAIDLSHNTWRTLPPELNDFSATLLHLSMSNNQLSSIPEAIGNLILLQSLDVSLNRIEHIDGAIGKCIRLRRLNASKNRLEALPPDIGRCILLEEVDASDNLLKFLPEEMLSLIVVTKIDVRNNDRLTSIPTALCRLPTLAQLLCEGTPQLTSAPENMRGDTKLLLFCLEMQQKFKDVLEPMEARHEELRTRSDRLQDELSQARRQVQTLERDVADLEWERPDGYILWKGRFVGCVRHLIDKIVQLWGTGNRAFWSWRERRRTHPLY